MDSGGATLMITVDHTKEIFDRLLIKRRGWPGT
jgi:hypothetical protein